MRIEELVLQNFRRFEHLKLEFHPRCTVLAGVNGSGKSSVLDGLAVAMGAWFIGFDGERPRNIHKDEVRIERVVLAEQTSIERQYPTRVGATGRLGRTKVEWARALRGERSKTTQAEVAPLTEEAKARQWAMRQGAPNDLPVLAYYGTGRLWLQKRGGRAAETLGSRSLGYKDCLNPASNHEQFKIWMRRQEQARIQQIADAMNGGQMVPADVVAPPALSAVQHAAVSCIEGAERLYFDVAHDELRVLFSDGNVLPFRLLSDGYRDVVALAADLAWRAVQLNPHQGADAPQRAQGIVLIDEIELHLHPSWQRTVLPALTGAFPNLQFVVSTHSPQVIASTPAEQLRFLDAEGAVHRVGVAQGLSSDVVLRELMGVEARPEWARQALAKLGQLIERGEVEAAREAFNALHKQLADLDPELQGLEWELHELEVCGAAD